MKIFSHNFNPASNSGPNKFSRQLFKSLKKNNNVTATSNQQEADVEFCLIQQQYHKVKPMVLRLDGIWFNSDQNYKQQNTPIKFSYENADAVIFQSEFNKRLTTHWFGDHDNTHVIHNAADLELIKSVDTNFWDKKFGKDIEIWSCASNWRPHKRLKENIRYFLEFAPKDTVFAIAGGLHMDEAKEVLRIDNRIALMGELDYMSLLSLYKRSSTFVHLAYLDHCPNVVVDAQAAGCRIVCSNSGGTSEIVSDGIVIYDKPWDFKPIKLYEPPQLDFKIKTKLLKRSEAHKKYSIVNCAEEYYNVFKRCNDE